jgi:hypothetical protein
LPRGGHPCVDTPGFARISSSVRSRDRVHPCVRPCFRGILAPLAGMVVRGAGPNHTPDLGRSMDVTHLISGDRWTSLGLPLPTFSDPFPLPSKTSPLSGRPA